MKFVIVIFVFLTSTLLVGCTSTTTHNQNSYLNFSAILNNQMGTANQDSIVSAFGEPAKVEDRHNYFIMIYDDPKTNFQSIVSSAKLCFIIATTPPTQLTRHCTA